jgi:hypothetical protein
MRAVCGKEADAGREADAEALLAENARLEVQLDGLHRALQSRATIEQAKGVLVVFCRCAEGEAFDVLVQLSQRRNVRVRVLADALLRLAAAGFEAPEEDELGRWLRDEVAALSEGRGRPPRGRDSAGRDSGREGAGRDSGRDSAGRDSAGRDSGREGAGRERAGREGAGRERGGTRGRPWRAP